MTDYTKLVEALRGCASGDGECCLKCTYQKASNMPCDNALMTDAADAIEALQDDMKTYGKTAYDEGYAIGFAAGENKAEKQLPKRGKIVRCVECKWYAPLDRKRPFFCPVMDCATGVMGDDFCSRGERRAKMEVQDA